MVDPSDDKFVSGSLKPRECGCLLADKSSQSGGGPVPPLRGASRLAKALPFFGVILHLDTLTCLLQMPAPSHIGDLPRYLRARYLLDVMQRILIHREALIGLDICQRDLREKVRELLAQVFEELLHVSVALHDGVEHSFEPLWVLGMLGRVGVAEPVDVAEPWGNLLGELWWGAEGGSRQRFGWLGQLF